MLLHVIVIVIVIEIVNHYPSSYIRRIVLYLVSLYLSKTANWQSKTGVKINYTIRERFRNFIINHGRALACLVVVIVY